MATDWLTGADPSWYPLVLAVLQRDFPDIADGAWSTAIGENAARHAQSDRMTAPGAQAVRGPVMGPDPMSDRPSPRGGGPVPYAVQVARELLAIAQAWGPFPLGPGGPSDDEAAAWIGRAMATLDELIRDDGKAATDAWQPPANPRTRKADRHRADRNGPLPDDDWTSPAAPPEDTPGSITPGRLTELHTWFTKRGITARDDRLAYTMSALDLPELASSKDLSEAQGAVLVKHLKEDTR